LSRQQIRFKNLKNTTKLFRDFIYKEESLSRWLHTDFRKAESCRETMRRLLDVDYRRNRLADILTDQNREFGASEKVFENIEKMRNENALCSVTGHQVGLLGGQMMIFYKALTAIKSAEKLTNELNHPVVPLFWMATDDHDLDEVDHIHLPVKDGSLQKIVYEPTQPISNIPMSHVQLDGNIRIFLDEVHSALDESEFKDDLLDNLSRCHADGEMIFTAFAKCFQRWFGDYGVIVVNPADPQLREMSKEIFKKEITGAMEVRSAIGKSNESLKQVGYHLQVIRDNAYTNLFVNKGIRTRVEFAGGQFVIEGETDSMTEEALLSRVDSSPDLFSPNVLLRPIVQSKLFPTILYAGGPAEIAYFSQISGLFDFFGVVPPIVRPRISATIIEPRYRRFIERHDIEISRLATRDDREMYLTEIMKARFPDGMNESMEQIQRRIAGALEDLRHLVEYDGNLVRTLDKTVRKIDYEINEFKGKVFKAFKKEQDELSRKFRMCAEQLFPEQSLQERHYSFVYFASKYGPGIVNTLYTELDIDEVEHQMVYL